MIFYEEDIKKLLKKGLLPKDVFKRLNNAFTAHENVLDLDKIKKFEKKERSGKVSFRRAADILKE